MYLPYPLLVLALKRIGCVKSFLQYRDARFRVENHSLRIAFLENCKSSEVIPKFLNFRIPNNGCFDEKSIHQFQTRLLRNELQKAKNELQTAKEKLENARETLKQEVRPTFFPTIIVYNRLHLRRWRKEQTIKLNDKLFRLSKEQARPLFNVQNTVMCYELDETPPQFVIDTLSLGPRSSIMVKFDQSRLLAEVDSLMNFCKKKDLSDELITDINIKTLTYIKNCKKQKSPRNIILTKRYLKEKKLLAVPFDKGIGICLMPIDKYNEKLRTIYSQPQFEKVVPARKNEKHPVLKEEENVVTLLKELRDSGEITEELFKKLKPIGSQPARLYGLAKVHKPNIPVRPVLSMPGSAYHKIALEVTEWLSVVDECKINSSTEAVSKVLPETVLPISHEIVSFDVTSLYTNVPVLEAINECSDLLYSGDYKKPPVDIETFKKLLTICTSNVLMLTNDGYFRQTDGLAMGSPPAPLLANGWLSKYDKDIQDDALLYFRYMDDIVRDIHTDRIESKLSDVNSLHDNLKFTIERENEQNQIPFLDMLIIRDVNRLSSTWYTKPTDTGLTMNYHALAPMKFKRGNVIGLIHRIYRSCSNWTHFHDSIKKAKILLENNQYPPIFYENLIEQTITKILSDKSSPNDTDTSSESEKEEVQEVKKFYVQYRGKISEKYQASLKRSDAPVNVIFTLRKLKTVMPSLKPIVEKPLKSGVVYNISCPRCKACYVGQTQRHLLTRIKEHQRTSSPVGRHMTRCHCEFTSDDVTILATSSLEGHLLTLEAILIRMNKPSINTKDEFRSRSLTIKF